MEAEPGLQRAEKPDLRVKRVRGRCQGRLALTRTRLRGHVGHVADMVCVMMRGGQFQVEGPSEGSRWAPERRITFHMFPDISSSDASLNSIKVFTEEAEFFNYGLSVRTSSLRICVGFLFPPMDSSTSRDE